MHRTWGIRRNNGGDISTRWEIVYKYFHKERWQVDWYASTRWGAIRYIKKQQKSDYKSPVEIIR